MADISLPDMSLIWGSGGDVLKPSDSKIQQGWQPEIPARQWFNWLDNRQDQAIAHIAQHGIAVWSNTLEYQAGKSYVQGSDGIVYKAITTNTNVDPVGNVGDWESAFLSASQAVQVATAAQSRAMTANNVYLSPLQLANAFTGTNQSVTTNGFQKLPGGLIIQWGFVNTLVEDVAASVTLNTPFTSTFFNVTACLGSDYGAGGQESVNAFPTSLTTFTVRARRGGSPVSVYWFAIGV